MVTFGDELQVGSRSDLPVPAVDMADASSLEEFLLFDVRLVVHRGRLGVILGQGSIPSYDAALIVASDVSSVDLGATTPKGAWYNWTLGGATASTFGDKTTVTLHPLFSQQGALRFTASDVEIRLGTSPATRGAPADYIADTEETIWSQNPGWGSEFVARAATRLHTIN
ncbi:hypothetical protein [Leifsonia sp. 1010]|uniref:hypothetical protein n=1 Tax=Leifsonia sp. 1010 TaxID=2817769 RepID=UPI0028597AE5|nr:hypothetical protein [Leifsonia sp. 1010]MDR6613354.1 hypothetical protein [Leifsonia sp. 1010]